MLRGQCDALVFVVAGHACNGTVDEDGDVVFRVDAFQFRVGGFRMLLAVFGEFPFKHAPVARVGFGMEFDAPQAF